MADASISQNQREFRCSHCDGLIRVSRNLPPTTGPCPHCSGIITSPAVEASEPQNSPKISAHCVEEDVAAGAQASISATGPETTAPRSPTPKISTKFRRCGVVSFMLVVIALILLGVAYVIVREVGKNPATQNSIFPGPASSSVSEANYVRIGWQKDATRILGAYMAATTPKEKIPHILNGEALAPQIEAFYGGNVINDSDTLAEDFSAFKLPEKDRQRGIFMMIYEVSPQINNTDSLAQAKIQPGSPARAAITTPEPVRVHAFFKRTENGLKLDWETFAQTKYRTFFNFVNQPQADHSGVFRVIVMEDVPEKSHAVHGTQSYRIVDPANVSDSVRVNVKIDSEAGRMLSELNRRDQDDNEPIPRTATVELRWAGKPNAPELVLNRFICWEFLGLGGEQAPSTAAKSTSK